MEKVLNLYETLFIISPQQDEEAVKATMDKFSALIAENGTVVNLADWGKRRLAYPINDIPEGHYVLISFKSGADFPLELERRFGIDDAIMRSIVIRLDEKKIKTQE